MFKHIFGPVPSRRLGISLGIDLVLDKTCNLNCIFCECGATYEFTFERKSFKNIDDVKYEIKEALKLYMPDYITFSGAGEPTLSKDIGEVINYIKDELKSNTKIAVITNGVLLSDVRVVEEIKRADLIIPTLNSVNEESFNKIVRPSEKVKLELVIQGLKNLSKIYKGEVYIEIFIVQNINDNIMEMEEIANFLEENFIRYSKIQLNSLDRVGAVENLKKVEIEKLKELRKYLMDKKLKNVEIVGEIKEINDSDKLIINDELFNNMNEKRKYTEDEIKKIFKK